MRFLLPKIISAAIFAGLMIDLCRQLLSFFSFRTAANRSGHGVSGVFHNAAVRDIFGSFLGFFCNFLGGKLAAGGELWRCATRRCFLIFRAQWGGQPARRGVSFSQFAVVVFAVGLLLSDSAIAGHRHLESWYADALAEELGSRTEVRMPNGTRCDVLSSGHAIEVEFAAKWCESIGQALNYASQTGRMGAVALILESPKDSRFLVRLRDVIAWHRLPIVVITLKPFGGDGMEMQLPTGFSHDRKAEDRKP